MFGPWELVCDLSKEFLIGVSPGEDFLHKLATDEFFPEKQREDLPGEKFPDKVIMEAWVSIEMIIYSCAYFGDQDMVGWHPKMRLSQIKQSDQRL